MPTPPVDLGGSRYQFPPSDQWPDDDLVGVGADLDPATVLTAYRAGLFPMRVNRRNLGWWSPMKRGVLPLDALQVSKSLRRSLSRYRVTFDQAFRAVMEACATSRDNGNWIDKSFISTYCELHQRGWAHSVEAWDDDRLVGGLYGIHIDGLFAGESMFHRATDASKVTTVALVRHLQSRGITLLDTQWQTPHLATLGVIEIDRRDYLERLGTALAQPMSWEG
jgi:leucyl/phenylalanyl-tRNA--protein transferase